MFMGAARTLSDLVSEDDLAQGSLYPALPRIRDVSAHIGAEVARIAWQRGLADGKTPNDMLSFIKTKMIEPGYRD
jgi:malate dehydrogenase (oxaloacetate-decarboxylating)(NADP+)